MSFEFSNVLINLTVLHGRQCLSQAVSYWETISYCSSTMSFICFACQTTL